MNQEMKQVDEQTLKENEFNSKEFYKKHPELNMPKLTGSFRRKLIRQNTVHLVAVCPNCGKNGVRYSKKEKKWVCGSCGTSSSRKEIEYVKYA